MLPCIPLPDCLKPSTLALAACLPCCSPLPLRPSRLSFHGGSLRFNVLCCDTWPPPATADGLLWWGSQLALRLLRLAQDWLQDWLQDWQEGGSASLHWQVPHWERSTGCMPCSCVLPSPTLTRCPAPGSITPFSAAMQRVMHGWGYVFVGRGYLGRYYRLACIHLL
jgi:hypothetical protein